jgi:hypothetical protein
MQRGGSLLSHGPVLSAIARHASPITLYQLQRAFPPALTRTPRVRDVVRARFVRYLERHFHPDAADIIIASLFFAPGASRYALTGSVLLAILLGEEDEWDCGDIDIVYIEPDPSVRAYNYPLPNGLPDIPLIASLMQANALHTLPGTHYYWKSATPAYAHECLFQCFDFMCGGGKKLQLLCVRSIEHARHYVCGFDLPFCRNLLGFGKEFACFSPSTVCSKSASVDVNKTYLFRQLPTCPEYIFHDYAPAKYARLVKYIERGFAIEMIQGECLEVPARYLDLTRERVTLPGTNPHHPHITWGVWCTFWNDRITRNGKLVLYRDPVWKRRRKE